MNHQLIWPSSFMQIWARLELMKAGVPFRDVVGFVQVNPYCVDLMYYVHDGDGHHASVHARWMSVFREIG